MSGYSGFEQWVGSKLDRFPRLKEAVEWTYQRANYHLLRDRNFTYQLHDDVRLKSVEAAFGIPTEKHPRFVGFYDIHPWSPSMDSFVVHEVDDPDGKAAISVINGEAVQHVARTSAWNYQQGSRTQWIPDTSEMLIYNDIEDQTLCARMLDVNTGNSECLPRPVQAVNPNGSEYLAIDYRRQDRNSPAYGYGLNDYSIRNPERDGIYLVPFEGNDELLVSFTDLITETKAKVPQEAHYLHHVRYAPNGQRFVFLHRWKDKQKRYTQLWVADDDGTSRCLIENRKLSHFCWIDNERIIIWGGTENLPAGYHTVDVTTGEVDPIDALADYGDGHPSLSPNGRWLVIDTYPDRYRKRSLTLYDRESGETIRLGEFLSPFRFEGATRCDLHPRWSPNGQFISIDSAHDGTRRSYILDVSAIVGG